MENAEEIKKYKLNRKLTTFTCAVCGKEATKPTSEFNRNAKLGRKNCCSRSCSIRNSSKTRTYEYSNSEKNKEHLKSISNNQRDEFTPFRYSFRNAKKRFKDFSITLEYLKEVWEKQNGICPYTGLKLKLPENSDTAKDDVTRASLDRIDSSKGYIEGNVQFISTPINYMKSTMSDSELKDFFKLIFSNSPFRED